MHTDRFKLILLQVFGHGIGTRYSVNSIPPQVYFAKALMYEQSTSLAAVLFQRLCCGVSPLVATYLEM